MSEPKLQSELKLFDVTNLVVGAIVGADIYVASSFGAGYLGPFSLLVWVIAGLIAIIIALCFAQCAALIPKVGGPYAYTKEAWGPFAGFIVGWSLWMAEWISLAVFPVAFTRYLMFFIPNLYITFQILVKVLFVSFLAAINIIGVRVAGKINDILTITKLVPLLFFSGIGLLFMFSHPSTAASNLSPFLPYGFGNFGTALVLIFWAYAGFEISTIPTDEIKTPEKTIPKAIILGITIVTIFYLVTNIALFGMRPWAQLATDTTPLTSATAEVLGTSSLFALVGAGIVGVGALVSVAGSDESGMIGSSRLGYALAVDGLFPHLFARIHKKFKTPYLTITIQTVTALLAAIFGNLTLLISTSVLFMAIAYIATCGSIFSLRKKVAEPQYILKGGLIIPSIGTIFSFYLISQCTITQIAIGLILILIGIPIYYAYSPKEEITELKNSLLSRSSILKKAHRQETRFLAYMLRYLKRSYRKVRHKKQTWES